MKRIKKAHADPGQRRLNVKDKLWVIPHDGTLRGDSAFYPPDPRFPHKEGMTAKDVRTLHEAKLRKEEDPGVDGWMEKARSSRRTIKEEAGSIRGAWVVDARTIRTLEASSIDCDNDSACYTANRMRKTMLNELAVGFIGKRPK